MQWVMAGLLHGCFAGVHATEHSSQAMPIACATTCTALLLFCAMILQAYDMHMCIRDVCSSDRFMRSCYWYNSDAYWGYHTLHSFPSPVFHTCVYMFLFVFSRQYQEGEGWGNVSCSVFTAQSSSVYFAHVFHRYCECGRVDRNPKKFVGWYS